jgi:hypothetical protein
VYTVYETLDEMAWKIQLITRMAIENVNGENQSSRHKGVWKKPMKMLSDKRNNEKIKIKTTIGMRSVSSHDHQIFLLGYLFLYKWPVGA